MPLGDDLWMDCAVLGFGRTLGSMISRRNLLSGLAATPSLFCAGERLKGAIIGSGGRGQFLTGEFRAAGGQVR